AQNRNQWLTDIWSRLLTATRMDCPSDRCCPQIFLNIPLLAAKIQGQRRTLRFSMTIPSSALPSI
ncbi:MAG TPA: hypothetical protein VGI33_11960, partial [Paenibacillus sp.]